MAKKGDKIGWSTSKTTSGSGWIYDGTHWVQHKNNKPTGRKEKHRISTTSARGLGIGTAAKKLFGKKDKPNTSTLKKNTSKSTSNTKKPKVKSVGTVDFNVNTESGKKAYNKALAASKTNKAKTDKAKDKSTTEALYGERNRAEAKKRKLRPKPGSAGARIQQKLKDGGHTQEGLDQIAARHQAWKKARKEGTLGDWEKKYHPDRTSKYKNKKKSTPKPTPKPTPKTTPKPKVTPKKKKKKSEIKFPTGPGGFRGF